MWGVLPNGQKLTYGDIHKEDERQWSHHNFEQVNADMCRKHFDDNEQQAQALLKANLPIPAYEYVLQCSHMFNVMDARGAVSVADRANHLARIRHLAKACCEGYLKQMENID